MAETPTREALLAARIAYLEVWHQDAEKGHAEAVAENNGLREAIGDQRQELEMMRLNIVKRGCCTVDGDEDGQ